MAGGPPSGRSQGERARADVVARNALALGRASSLAYRGGASFVGVRGSHHRRAPSSGRQRYRGARTGSSPYRGIRFARAKSIRLRDSILITPEPKSASRCAKQPLLVDRVCPTSACARTAESRKRDRGGVRRARSAAVDGWRAGEDSNPRPSDPKKDGQKRFARFARRGTAKPHAAHRYS